MSRESTNHLIPGCGTHHLAVQTQDLEASLRLYRDVLGMLVVAGCGAASVWLNFREAELAGRRAALTADTIAD